VKVHEYQAKGILAKYGVTVPRGEVARTGAEALGIARSLGGRVVIKAQIHAGGRGKGIAHDAKTGEPLTRPGESKPLGGVRVVAGPEEAEAVSALLLGSRLKTLQTGPEGREVKTILVEEALDIANEYYVGVVVDRAAARTVVMASAEGGVEIEKVASEKPEAILKSSIDPAVGFSSFAARKLAYGIGVRRDSVSQAVKLLSALYRAFLETDASLAEVNPLVVTGDGKVIALDAKMNFDDNALYRHEDIRQLRDLDEEEPLEVEASRFGLSYIKLDGTVGCMVNGAGLAMATMDIIKLAGGEPANFLDVGGGATEEQVSNAFRILLSDANVRAVLINIFGGIMRCDVVAEGVVAAAREVGVKVPIVVRLEGTNVEKGREILKKSGMELIVASGMEDAAAKVVRASGGRS
jgi:succinyl-CoA synthetase beta subunit